MVGVCKLHRHLPALYHCEGCDEFLCGHCIEESHVLLLCRLCGERAWPLREGQPTTTRELEKARRRARPYGLADTLLYPFRGTNIYLFLMVLLCLAVIGFLWIIVGVTRIAMDAMHTILWLMIVDLQYKIVRSTADGDNDIPDWADVTDLASLAMDAVRSMATDFAGILLSALSASWWVLHALVIVSFGYFAEGLPELLENLELRTSLQVGVIVAFWCAVAFTVMAYGSAGIYSRDQILLVHRHIRGFVSAGVDAIWITNTVFLLGAGVVFLQFRLGDIPLAGWAACGVVGAYWALVFPHLVGFLFRRHSTKMDRIYRTA